MLRRRPREGIFLLLYLLVPFVGVYVAGEMIGRSIFHERYLIIVSPALYLLVAAGIGTHLLSADERVWGQQDSVPCGGGCPTSDWAAGDEFADNYTLAASPDAPPGTYKLEVGMYRAEDGRRLPVTDAAGQPAGDRAIIGEVTVGKSPVTSSVSGN